MLDHTKSTLEQVNASLEQGLLTENIDLEIAIISAALKNFETQHLSKVKNDLGALVKLTVDIYNELGWELRKLNNSAKQNSQLKNSLKDILSFYDRLDNFLKTIFNKPEITPQLIAETQELLKVDPNYLPTALPIYLVKPKVSEDPVKFNKRRMKEHLKAHGTGQVISLVYDENTKAEIGYKSAIRFHEEENIEARAASPTKDYVKTKIAALHEANYQAVNTPGPSSTPLSKKKEAAPLSSFREFIDRIQYYDPKERLQYRKFIYAGKLFELNKDQDAALLTFKPASTEQNFSKAIAGIAAFVISSHGDIYAGSHISHYYEGPSATQYQYHSSFTSGSYVMFAGEIQVGSDGTLLAITNQSGHYRPGLQNFFNAYRFMKAQGTDFSHCTFRFYSADQERPEAFSEQEFLDFYKHQLTAHVPQAGEVTPTHISPNISLTDQLHEAFRAGNFAAIDSLLTQGVKFAFQDQNEAVLYAAHAGLRYLEVLAKHKFNFHFTNADGNNALHIATYKDPIDIEVVKFLIMQGLNINQKNKADKSPYMLAQEKGIDLLRELISPQISQADISLDTESVDEITPLLSEKEGNIETIAKQKNEYTELLNDVNKMLSAQTASVIAFLPDYLDAAITILSNQLPELQLNVDNAQLQDHYKTFVEKLTKLYIYKETESSDSFVRSELDLLKEKLELLTKIKNPFIQAYLLDAKFTNNAKVVFSNDQLMSYTNIADLDSYLNSVGFDIHPDSDIDLLDKIKKENLRIQKFERIDNEALRKLLSHTAIHVKDEVIIAINKFLVDPNLTHAVMNKILGPLIGKSFYIDEKQFKAISREIKIKHLKQLGVDNQIAVEGIYKNFTNQFAEVATASQAFKQQRYPNIFRSKLYNLERTIEMAELLSSKIYGLDEYHRVIDKIKLIEASDMQASVTATEIRQHEKALLAFEIQIKNMIKQLVDELDYRSTKLAELAKSLQQNLEKDKNTDKLIADWKLQEPAIEKLLGFYEQLNELDKHYKMDEKTSFKLIHRLDELNAVKRTLFDLTAQAANKEINAVKLSLVPEQQADIPAIKPIAAAPKTFVNEIVPVSGTPGLTYLKKDGDFIYTRPKTYVAKSVSRSKNYTEDEKLVFEAMARERLATLTAEPQENGKHIIIIDGNKSMATKVAIWLTAINTANKTIPNLEVQINGKKFSPSIMESYEIRQKISAESKKALPKTESKISKLVLTDNNEEKNVPTNTMQNKIFK